MYILAEESSHYKHINPAVLKKRYRFILYMGEVFQSNTYLSGRNKCKKTWLDIQYRGKQEQIRENVTNVNSLFWVFSNKCLPGELMIGGEMCKPIRR